MVTALGQWGLWGVEGLGHYFIFLGWESCAAWWEQLKQEWLWSFNGVSGTFGRNGKCRIGCNCPCCYHGGASIGWRAVQAAAVTGRRAKDVPSKVVASVVGQMGVGLWSAVMSPMSGTIIGVWPVPLAVGVLMPWMRSSMVVWCSWWRNLGGSPGQNGQIHHSHNTGHQRSGSLNDLSIHRQNMYHHQTSYWL